MRKVLGLVFLLSLFIAETTPRIASAQRQTKPTDPFQNVRFLIGTWNCTSSMVAMSDMPASTIKGMLTFSWGPGNSSIHEMFSAPNYESHGFMGFDAANRRFYLSSVDNYGDVTSEVGQSASDNGITFVGTATMRGRSMQLRDRRTKVSDTHITSVGETMQGGTWKQVDSTDCTKT